MTVMLNKVWTLSPPWVKSYGFLECTELLHTGWKTQQFRENMVKCPQKRKHNTDKSFYRRHTFYKALCLNSITLHTLIYRKYGTIRFLKLIFFKNENTSTLYSHLWSAPTWDQEFDSKIRMLTYSEFTLSQAFSVMRLWLHWKEPTGDAQQRQLSSWLTTCKLLIMVTPGKSLEKLVGWGVCMQACMRAHVCNGSWANGGTRGTGQAKNIHFLHTWANSRLSAEQEITNLIERMKASFSGLLHNHSRLKKEENKQTNTLKSLIWGCTPKTKREPRSQGILGQECDDTASRPQGWDPPERRPPLQGFLGNFWIILFTV